MTEITLTGTVTLTGIVESGEPPPPDDPFELGETEPTTRYAFTSAAHIGPRVPEVTLSNYDGTFDNLADGDVVERLAITGRFRPHARTFTLRDSIVLGGEPAGDDHDPASRNAYFWLLDFTDDAIDAGLIEFVEVRPSYQSHEIGGIKGGNVKLSRSLIRGVVDGGQPHGTSQRRKRFIMHGTRIDHLATFPDPTQSDGWTHTDGNQAAGALDEYDIYGCSIHGGRTSALLIQQSIGTYGVVRVRRSWLYGDTEEGSTLNTSEGEFGPIGVESFEVTGNRFNRSGRTAAWIKPATFDSEGFVWADNTYPDGELVVPKRG